VTILHVINTGFPWREILDVEETENPSLILIGYHGRSKRGDTFLLYIKISFKLHGGQPSISKPEKRRSQFCFFYQWVPYFPLFMPAFILFMPVPIYIQDGSS